MLVTKLTTRKRIFTVLLFSVIAVLYLLGLIRYNYVVRTNATSLLKTMDMCTIAGNKLNISTSRTYQLLYNICCKTKRFSGNKCTPALNHEHLVISKNETSCLKQVINQSCFDGKPVPNIIHYVWLGKSRKEMKFYQFLSVYSTHKFLHPCLILFHGETLPYGHYWNQLQTIVPNIIHVYRTAPTEIEGITIKYIEHKADIARFEALREYGGIYMDMDSVALKSMDQLRSYDFTLGIDNPGVLGIGTILSAPNAEFLNLWLGHYITFDPDKWGWHSVILPYKLSKKYPDLIHVEENYTFYYGGSSEKLISRKIKWGHMYAMHLSMRYHYFITFDEYKVCTLDTTLGEIARHILFGSVIKCQKCGNL